MKKLIVIGIAALLCASCQLESGQGESTLKEKLNTSGAAEPAEMAAPEVAVPQQTAQAPVVSAPRLAAGKYASDADRYRQNIVVKVMGENYIVYEYSDVRIDDVATLASAFCYETDPDTKAYLRDVYMYRNHKRRATFDCVNLASK